MLLFSWKANEIVVFLQFSNIFINGFQIYQNYFETCKNCSKRQEWHSCIVFTLYEELWGCFWMVVTIELSLEKGERGVPLS